MKRKIDPQLFSNSIAEGDLGKVKDLVLNQGYDINMIDNSTAQPMFTRAILSQNVDIINFFFEQNADVNPTWDEGDIFMTPLVACMRFVMKANSKMEAVFDKLLASGANPNPLNSSCLPLTEAIENHSDFSNTRLIYEKLVTNYKADVNHGEAFDKPIIAAIKKGDLELVKFLVTKGADIQVDGNCNATITTAIVFNQADITKYLIEEAITDNKTFSSKWIVELAHKSQNQEILNLFNSKIDVDANEFALAISQGNLSKVEYLVLMQGADINMLDNTLMPMFSHAILSKSQAMINFFFEQKAHVNPLHEKVSMTPLGAAAAVETKATSIMEMDYTFLNLLNQGAEINPSNSTHSPLISALQYGGKFVAAYLIDRGANLNIGASYQEQIVEVIKANETLSEKFMMKGILKVKGLETNIFHLTLSDIIKQLQDIDNIEFTKPIETNRQYLDIVMQVYLDSRYRDENKEQLHKFYEIMTSLFRDHNKTTKLIELGATYLDASFITDDINAIYQISCSNSETNIYNLAQKYRMAYLSKDIHPDSQAMSLQIALNGSFVSISSLPYNAFVTQSDGAANNLFINITCDGGAVWDYNKAGYFSKCIESSFATTILLGNGTQYISPSDISNIFNHDKMNLLREQNLEFALVTVNSHDSKESKSFSSVLKSLTTKLAKSTVILIDSCYSGQYHEEYIAEKGVFLISASNNDETSCGAERASEFSGYFSGQPNLLGVLKYCAENYTRSTPCFSGQIGKKIFKGAPIKELLEELGGMLLVDNLGTDEVIQVVQKENADKKFELWSTLSTHSTESEAWGYVPPHYLGYDDIVHVGDDEYNNYGDSDNCGCIII